MNIDFVHDVVCPWCRIGRANLKAAALLVPETPLNVQYRPFLLNPATPEAGVDFRGYMAQVAGNADLSAMFERVTEAGKAVGLTFNFDKISRYPSSIPAHMLLLAAPEADRERLLDAIHTAYFEDGQDIGDRTVLLEIAASLGLDTRPLGAALHFPQFKETVEAQTELIRKNGISAVPFFIFDNLVALSGAYPPAQLVQAIAKAKEAAAASEEPAVSADVAPGMDA